MEITSINNPLIKETVKLQQKNIEIRPANSFLKDSRQ